MSRAYGIKPETMKKRIENARALVKNLEERVDRRKERLARAEACVKKCKEDVKSYEERLEGARGMLSGYEYRAALLEKNGTYV